MWSREGGNKCLQVGADWYVFGFADKHQCLIEAVTECHWREHSNRVMWENCKRVKTEKWVGLLDAVKKNMHKLDRIPVDVLYKKNNHKYYL